MKDGLYCKFCFKPLRHPTNGLEQAKNKWLIELLDLEYVKWAKKHGVCQQCMEHYKNLRYVEKKGVKE